MIKTQEVSSLFKFQLHCINCIGHVIVLAHFRNTGGL